MAKPKLKLMQGLSELVWVISGIISQSEMVFVNSGLTTALATGSILDK